MHVEQVTRRKILFDEISCYQSNYDVSESEESRIDFEEACNYAANIYDFTNLALSIEFATPSSYKNPSILVADVDETLLAF